MFRSKIRVFTESVAEQIKQIEKRLDKLDKKFRERRIVYVKTYWDSDLPGCKNAD